MGQGPTESARVTTTIFLRPKNVKKGTTKVIVIVTKLHFQNVTSYVINYISEKVIVIVTNRQKRNEFKGLLIWLVNKELAVGLLRFLNKEKSESALGKK